MLKGNLILSDLRRNMTSVKFAVQNHEPHRVREKSSLFGGGEQLFSNNFQLTGAWQEGAFEPQELFNIIPENIRTKLFYTTASATPDVKNKLTDLLLPYVNQYLGEMYPGKNPHYLLVEVIVSYMISELERAFIHSGQRVSRVMKNKVDSWTHNHNSNFYYQFGKNGYHKRAIKIRDLPEIGLLQFKSRDSLKDVDLELRLRKYVADSKHEEFKKRISFQYGVSELMDDEVLNLGTEIVNRIQLLIKDIAPDHKICYYHQKNDLGIDYVELIDFVKNNTEDPSSNKAKRIELAHVLANQLIDLLQALDDGKYSNADPHSGNIKLYFDRNKNIVRMEIFDHGKSSFGADYDISTNQYVFHEGKSYKIIQQGMSSPDVKCRRMVIALIFYLVLGNYQTAYAYFKHGEFRDRLNVLVPPSATTVLINTVLGYNSLHSTTVVHPSLGGGGTTEVTQSTTGSAASSTIPYEKIRKLLDNSIETLALSLNNK